MHHTFSKYPWPQVMEYGIMYKNAHWISIYFFHFSYAHCLNVKEWIQAPYLVKYI